MYASHASMAMAEQERAAAENERMLAELGRADAEDSRKAAEEARKEADEHRQDAFEARGTAVASAEAAARDAKKIAERLDATMPRIMHLQVAEGAPVVKTRYVRSAKHPKFAGWMGLWAQKGWKGYITVMATSTDQVPGVNSSHGGTPVVTRTFWVENGEMFAPSMTKENTVPEWMHSVGGYIGFGLDKLNYVTVLIFPYLESYFS